MLNFDLESNGLLDTITKIHCMSIGQVETEIITRYRPDEVEDSVKRILDAIMQGEQISGHNIINYDIPAINLIFPFFKIPRECRHLVIDTLVLASLVYSNIDTFDAPMLRSGRLPKELYKRQSLEAWGYRLGKLKGKYSGTNAEDKWAVFNEEMLDYNEQDVVVDMVLLKKLQEKGYSEEAIKLEHEVAWLIAQQQRNGVNFNIKKAQELELVLQSRLATLEAVLLKEAPLIPGALFVPKRNNKTLGYKKGVAVQKYKAFNAGSRDQIKYITNIHFGYYPDEIECYKIPKEVKQKFTEDQLIDMCKNGKIPMSVNDDTFTYIAQDPDCPEGFRKLADLFRQYLMVSKRLGQLSTGKQAWLTSVKDDGKIHGSVQTNGAVTGRATHSSPNLSQIPAIGKEYGKECRELFEPPEGWYQVGVDASSLELRCLAHFMFPFDGGAYAEAVVNGKNEDGTDVHSMNMRSAGLDTRNNAKTFIYAFLYGAGDAKIGKIVGGSSLEGKRLKKAFLDKTPAIGNVKQMIENALVEEMYRGRVRKWKRKWLKGLDGRHLHIRSLHSALNTLLQSAGALICKKWMVTFDQMMYDLGYVHDTDGDFFQMLWIHDELGLACRTKEIAEVCIEVAQKAMRETQKYFKFRVQLDIEGKIGRNWGETH